MKVDKIEIEVVMVNKIERQMRHIMIMLLLASVALIFYGSANLARIYADYKRDKTYAIMPIEIEVLDVNKADKEIRLKAMSRIEEANLKELNTFLNEVKDGSAEKN